MWSSSWAHIRPTRTGIDPRRIDLGKPAQVAAAHPLALGPGTNMAVLAAHAHMFVTEGLADETFIAARLFRPGPRLPGLQGDGGAGEAVERPTDRQETSAAQAAVATPAPADLALAQSDAARLTLAAFGRDGWFDLSSHPARVQTGEADVA